MAANKKVIPLFYSLMTNANKQVWFFCYYNIIIASKFVLKACI